MLAIVAEPWADGRILNFDEHPNFVDAWQEMEKLLASGQWRSFRYQILLR